MHNDKFGRQILTETDICEAYLRDPDINIIHGLVNTEIKFNNDLELSNVPNLSFATQLEDTIENFDNTCQSNWYMPEEYKSMDIAKWVLDQCVEDYELQRVGQELLLYQEKDLFPLLCYCKYLVDTMRKHNVIWGVGRGSSVSSYVLYLIGVHRINSLHYDLSIDEFLK